MGIASIIPSQRLGLTDDPMMAEIGTAGQTWLIGALLTFTSGLLTECPGNVGAGVAAGTVLGVAAEPFVAAITASGGTAIGQEVQTAVGGGTAISGPRRRFYPAIQPMIFIGTLDTFPSPGTALSVADIGTTFAMSGVTPATGATVAAGGVWVLNRTGATKSAIVTRLIDPPGAKTTDVPNIGAGNSGNALVEFMFLAGARMLT